MPIPHFFVEGPCLLIEHPTGIWYSGQVGGMACEHPKVEGFVVPLQQEDMRSLEGVSCPDACWNKPISKSLSEKIKAVWPIQRYVWLPFAEAVAEFDDSRIEFGTECWFPIVLRGYKEFESYQKEGIANAAWLDGKRGWLLMHDNCD